MGYTLFIDESGDQGINKIRDSSYGGQSPYLILGAALVENKNIENITKKIEKIEKDIRGQKKNFYIHFSKMRHLEKVYVCREFSKLDATFFGLISKKETLGDYAKKICYNPQQYYNKNIQYFLEIIGKAFKELGISLTDQRIVFEEIANFPYETTRNYISKIKQNPLNQNALSLKYIDPQAIESSPKKEEPLLCLADCVAYSLHQCCKDWKGVYESRYVYELRSHFYCNDSGIIKNSGIKFIHNIEQCCPSDNVNFFKNLKAK